MVCVTGSDRTLKRIDDLEDRMAWLERQCLPGDLVQKELAKPLIQRVCEALGVSVPWEGRRDEALNWKSVASEEYDTWRDALFWRIVVAMAERGELVGIKMADQEDWRAVMGNGFPYAAAGNAPDAILRLAAKTLGID